MPALALTDHGNLYGAVEFLREAKAAGIKPIVGLEAYVAPGKRYEKTTGGGTGQEHSFHLTLLARDAEGFRNLLRLSSRSFLEGFYYKPRIDKEILAQHAEGPDLPLRLRLGRVLRPPAARQERRGRAALRLVPVDFGEENFYVEIQDNGVGIQRECKERALDVARRMGLPVVATSDAHYLTREDAQAHDILLCINTGKTVDDPDRMRFETDQFHVRSARGDVRGDGRARGGAGRLGDGSPTSSRTITRASTSARATSPPSRRPGARRPRNTSATSASRAWRSATATRRRSRPSRGSTTSCGSSTGWGSPRTS